MRGVLRGICTVACVGIASPTLAAEPIEQIVQVPGFADFLAIDGKSVWTTNRAKVEQWTLQGKVAEVPMGRACGTMVIAYKSLWVADCVAKTLNRVDIKAGTMAATIQTGLAAPDGEMNVVSGAGSIWVASDAAGTISRIDPKTNAVIATVSTKPGAVYLTFGFGSVWAASPKSQTLERIDPATNAVIATVPLGKQPGFLTAGEDGVWVQEQGDGTLAVIDPRTNSLRGRIKVGDNLKYGDIDTGGGKVWLRTTDDQTFVVINAQTLEITARVGKASGSGAVRYSKAGVWTSAHDNFTLSWWPKPANIGN